MSFQGSSGASAAAREIQVEIFRVRRKIPNPDEEGKVLFCEVDKLFDRILSEVQDIIDTADAGWY